MLDFIQGAEAKQIFRSAEGKRLADQAPEVRIRLALTELGTTFIKLGQILSTRPDLVGPELAAELGHLQSGTPADPPDTTVNVASPPYSLA